MYTKVLDPSIHGTKSYSNTGSCAALVNYLNKENEALPLLDRELFFNQERNNVTSHEVLKAIDTNHKGLRKDSPKFHSLVIAPDELEQKHISSNPEAFKNYVRDVMEQYASNFNFPDGKLKSDDLVWFGKLEYLRNNNNKGYDMHVHIIVSARDKEQSVTLNPNTNKRNRFNRVQFSLKSERAFDKKFDYERQHSRLAVHQTRKHGILADRLLLYQGSIRNSENQEMLHNIASIFQNLDYGNEQDSLKKRRRKR